MPRLIYIVGASGVGKDALMRYARNELNGSLSLLFAHRYITRPAGEGSENHVAISAEEFRLRKERGLFALDWESHGLHYGIGTEIDSWMDAGFHVVVNGSRQYLQAAKGRYPEMIAIVIEADPVIVRMRLENRARESAVDIEDRIQRQPALEVDGLIRISNNGLLEQGGAELTRILKSFPAGS